LLATEGLWAAVVVCFPPKDQSLSLFGTDGGGQPPKKGKNEKGSRGRGATVRKVPIRKITTRQPCPSGVFLCWCAERMPLASGGVSPIHQPSMKRRTRITPRWSLPARYHDYTRFHV